MNSEQQYDFSGYVTKANIRCSDGRVIKPDAFKGNDNGFVPMVYHHNHSDMDCVIGKMKLENRTDGVYGYGYFNATPKAQLAKELVRHGDITALSIYANKLVQKGSDVIHGIIREVSLVMAGANDGAFIENVVIQHGSIIDGTEDILDLEEAVIVCGSELKHEETSLTQEDSQKDSVSSNIDIKAIAHELKEFLLKEKSESKEVSSEEVSHAAAPMLQDVLGTMTDEQLSVIELYILDRIYGDEVTQKVVSDLSSMETDTEPTGKTVQEIIDSMNDDQKNAFYTLIESIEEEFGEEIDTLNEVEETTNTAAMQQNDGGSEVMKANTFEQNGAAQAEVLTHTYADVKAAMEDTKKWGSMRESFLQHGITDLELGQILAAEGRNTFLQHSVQNVDMLFPDARAVSAMPDLNKVTPDSWINYVITNTKHLPFSRVKSWALDITEEEARAKGYIKGTQKLEEVIKAMRRITTPTTVYKLQKMDRDDIVDITDFDIVLFLRQEMHYMLQTELARAFLVGDGRAAGSPDKINEDNIRPIWTDVAPYVIRVTLDEGLPVLDLIDEVIRSRSDFNGTGTPAFFGGSDTIANMRLVRGTLDNRRLYSTDADIAAEMRVSSIHEVPVMEGLTRVNTAGDTVALKGIIVNLRDYAVGSTAGGQVTMFDDFDIDFNKYAYLIETRLSGALTIPRSAIVFEQVVTPAP